MTSLHCLLVDVLYSVGEFLGDKDLAHLAQTDKFFNDLFCNPLMKRSLEDKPPRVVKIPALIWAVDYGHQNLVQRIVSNPSFRPYGTVVFEALSQAAAKGHSGIVSTLLEAGCRPTAYRQPETPLHLSAFNGHPAATKLLLEHGAEIDAKDAQGRTAFRLATMAQKSIFHKLRSTIDFKRLTGTQLEIRRNQLRCDIHARVLATLRILVEHGAHSEISVADRWGNTPLHDLVGHIFPDQGSDCLLGSEILRFLVDQGASLESPDSHGDSPIHRAVHVSSPCYTSLNFFLDMGMSPNLKDHNGDSLLTRALCFDEHLSEVLLRRGAETDTVDLPALIFNWAIEDPCLTVVRLLFSYGAKFDSNVAAQGITSAADGGMLEVMRLIFEETGADINTPLFREPARPCETPLSIAIREKRKDMLKFLVENGVRMTDEERDEVENMLCLELD